MIALVMKHFSLAKDIHALLYYCSDMKPFTNIRNIFTQCFVFSTLQMNVSFGTRAYCRNYTIQAGIAET